MSNVGAIRAGRAFVELFCDNTKLTAGLKLAQQQVATMSAKMSNFGYTMLSAGFGTGLPFAHVLKTFVEFDDVMRSVQAISGETGEAFQKLTDQARELGRQTSFTASQVGQGMQELARAGFKQPDIESSIADVMNLSRATGVDLAEAANIATNALWSFGLSASDTGYVADVLVATANNSAQNLTDMGEALKYVAPIADEVGLSLDDVCKVLGQLANLGIKGSTAGTSMRQILVRMADPSVREMYAQLGVSVTDAAGNMRNMSDVLRDLGQATDGLPNADKLAIFRDLFDMRALPSGAKLAVSSFQSVIDAVDNAAGVAAKTSEQMDAGIGGAFRRMLSSFESFELTMGNALDHPVQRMVYQFKSVCDVIDEMVKLHSSAIWSIMKFSAAMIVGGSALVAFGIAAKLTAGAIGLITFGLSSVAKVALFPFKVIGTGLKMTASLAGLAARSLISVGGAVVSGIGSVVSVLGTVVSGIVSVIGAIASGILSVAVWTASGIVSIIAAIVPAVLSIMAAVGGAVASALAASVSFVGTLVVSLIAVTNMIITAIAGYVALFAPAAFALAFAGALAYAMNKAGQGIAGAVRGIVASVAGVFNGIYEMFVSMFNGIIGFFSDFSSFVAGVVSSVSGALAGAFNSLMGFLGSLWNGIVGFFSGVGNFFGEFASSVSEWFSGAFGKIGEWVEYIKERFGAFGEYAVDVFNMIAESVSDGKFAAAAEMVWASLKMIWDTGCYELISIWNGLCSKSHELWVSSTYGMAGFFVKSIYGAQMAWGAFVNAVADMWSGCCNFVAGLWDKTAAAIESAIVKAHAFVTGQSEDVTAKLLADIEAKYQQRAEERTANANVRNNERDAATEEKNNKLMNDAQDILNILAGERDKRKEGIENEFNANKEANQAKFDQAKANFDEAMRNAPNVKNSKDLGKKPGMLGKIAKKFGLPDGWGSLTNGLSFDPSMYMPGAVDLADAMSNAPKAMSSSSDSIGGRKRGSFNASELEGGTFSWMKRIQEDQLRTVRDIYDLLNETGEYI